MHACTGTMYIRTYVHRLLCTHVVYVVVWQSSSCHVHRVARVHAESYSLHSRVWEEFNGVGNSNTHVPVFNALLPSAGVLYTTVALI